MMDPDYERDFRRAEFERLIIVIVIGLGIAALATAVILDSERAPHATVLPTGEE